MGTHQESLEQRALKWASENRETVGKFFEFADQAWASGTRPIGAKLIVERMRWSHLIEKKSSEEFKINNSYTSHLARLYIKAHPERASLFRFRETQP